MTLFCRKKGKFYHNMFQLLLGREDICVTSLHPLATETPSHATEKKTMNNSNRRFCFGGYSGKHSRLFIFSEIVPFLVMPVDSGSCGKKPKLMMRGGSRRMYIYIYIYTGHGYKNTRSEYTLPPQGEVLLSQVHGSLPTAPEEIADTS